MEFHRLIDSLTHASLFELFRLNKIIDKMLDDPIRLKEIKRALKINQKITYFDARLNQEVEAVILRFKRNSVSVQNTQDACYWTIPLYMINVSHIKTDFAQKQVDRLTLKIGATVGFLSRANEELYGTVVKLNQKTASVKLSSGAGWRVSYRCLFYVTDTIQGFAELV